MQESCSGDFESVVMVAQTFWYSVSQVSLALTVMQRRLVCLIFALRNTLERCWNALQGIVDEVHKNPESVESASQVRSI
ncbi:hypothetical protein CSA56_07845 [candidate division KSB3 bacterium]|uniref:Uncharacterized protein n=1 Tax=candidate division KSB3 bacterium TaxID=2044937 RepID=A0A2G6KHK6_9BACT|nr:MAG: hypothetical protein CSA56_07845 [candidate division KSB3 bacterium]